MLLIAPSQISVVRVLLEKISVFKFFLGGMLVGIHAPGGKRSCLSRSLT